MSEYINKNVTTNEELLIYKKTFDENGSPKSIERLNWMHFQNLLKEPLVSYAVAEKNKNVEKAAALYAVFPVICKYYSEQVKATQSIDTITDINHRGKGLFINLAKDVYSMAFEKGYKFVYGFPNKNSAPGFFKKLGWKEICEVPFLIKPLRSSYFFKSIFKRKLIDFGISFPSNIKLKVGYSVREIKTFDSAFDYIWNQFSKNINISINRDSKYLNWRLVEKPDFTYFKKALFFNENPVGFVIYSIEEKHNGKIAYLLDLIYLPEEEKHANKLLKIALKEIREEKCDLILAWCFKHSPNYNLIKGKGGFFTIPLKLRPIELFFGANFFNEKNENNYKTENWYISYLDSDTV